MNPGDIFCFKCSSKFAEIPHPSTRISTPEDEHVSSSSSAKSLSQYLASKAEERRRYKLNSQTTTPVWKGTSTIPWGPPRGGGYLGPRIQFSFQSSYVHMDLMVLAQSLDNFIVPKSPQLLMYYYQPLICGTAQTFLLMSLYCSTLPTEYFIALKLSATFMAELTSYFML